MWSENEKYYFATTSLFFYLIVQAKKRKEDVDEKKEEKVGTNGVEVTEKESAELPGEAYDPENPGSENEKDPELENSKEPDSSTTVPSEDVNASKEPKIVVSDVLLSDQKDDSVEAQGTAAELQRKGRSKQTAVRGPRARRGRRH